MAMSRMKQLAALTMLAGVAACGAQANAQTSWPNPPTCSTWTSSNGSTDVLRLHHGTGATITGTDSAGGLNVKIQATFTGPHTFSGTMSGGGITVPLHAYYTKDSVKLAGKNGHDTFTTANGCPS